MAGKTIYTGDMIAALEAKIDTMVSSLASQVTKMDTQITKLDNVITAISQSATDVNLKPSATLFVALNNANAVITNPALNTWTDLGLRFVPLVNGVATVKMSVKTSSAATIKWVGYAFDGSTDIISLFTGLTTAYVEKTFTINLQKGRMIKFYGKNTESASGGTFDVQANTLKVYAELGDIVNDAAAAVQLA